MQYKRLFIVREAGVARVALNRPDVRNAMDETALDEITQAFHSLAKDKTVRVAVISGNGQDFCAGADIAWMRRAAEYSQAQAKKDASRLIGMCRAVDEAPFAVIARVQGNCFGGGLGVISACDIVIAEEGARFRFSEVRLGIIPAVVSTFVLPKIGMSHARHLYLTAEIFSAYKAKEIGLIHAITNSGNLDAEVNTAVEKILKNGPQAVREAKAYVKKLENMSRDKRIAYSGPLLAKIRSGAEAKEGLGAFLEKREPKWAA